MKNGFFEALETRTSFRNRYLTLFVRGQVLLLSVGAVLGLVKWILTKDWWEVPFHLALYAGIGLFVSCCLSLLLYLSDLYSRLANQGREQCQTMEWKGAQDSVREAVNTSLRDFGVAEILNLDSDSIRATTCPTWRSPGELIEVTLRQLESGRMEIRIESSGSSYFDFGKHAWNASQIMDRLRSREET